MNQQQNIKVVLEALQKIISSPGLAVSQSLSPGQDNAIDSFPVLPKHIPDFRIPHFEDCLSKTTSANNGTRSQESLSNLSDHLVTAILPYLNQSSLSPRYYGFVTGGVTPAALLGDFLTTLYDQNVQVHLPTQTLATTLEVATLNLLGQLFRLPEQQWSIGRSQSSGGGTFTTGATASNIMGLALGREYVLRERLRSLGSADTSSGDCGIAELMLVAGVKNIQVLSTLPHSGLAKAASIIGIGRRNVISIAANDDPLQIDVDKLKHEAQRKDVLNILAISSGEVNTGHFATNSFSQWQQIRAVCDEHKIWIHVDGAFGLFARLFSANDPSHAEFHGIAKGGEGLELADSITGDCHKLFNVPYDCGVFFTRHKDLLQPVFQNGNAAYLSSGINTAASSNPADNEMDAIQSPLNIGIENSRRFRALPVYCTLRAYGRSGYEDMLMRQIRLARRITSWLLKHPGYEVLPSLHESSTLSSSSLEREQQILQRTFIIVLFTTTHPETMETFVQRVNDTGKMYLSGTVWQGKKAARMAVSNWQVHVERDGRIVEEVLEEIVGSR
jgi:glutamate/tyrosine decarboxylase-like PLP-dependent enzyme